ncbi:MAG: VCBS repeat-containing protein [Candidatus Marinimicrobia bacterium]|nr:VCBS repeat-containing protein [Candidatus Neomarinimicrobiota bacterium]
MIYFKEIQLSLLVIVSTIAGETGIAFRDVTDELGIAPQVRPPATGSLRLYEAYEGQPLLFDYDRDNDLDLFLAAGYGPYDSLLLGYNRLYRNDDTNMVDVTKIMGLDSLPPAGSAAAGDVDGDGFLDLYLCMLDDDILLHNDSGIVWTDISESAGISNSDWALEAVFFDATGDGFVDVYVANFVVLPESDTLLCRDPATNRITTCEPEFFDPAPNRLYVNNGAGLFTDQTQQLGMLDTTSRSQAVKLLDANSDNRVDLLVQSYRSPNLLYLAGDGPGFQEVGLESGLALAPDGTDPIWNEIQILDMNADGHFDVLFARQDGRLEFMLNDGYGHFFPGLYQVGLQFPRHYYGATAVLPIDLNFDGAIDLLLADRPDSNLPEHEERDGLGRRFAQIIYAAGNSEYEPSDLSLAFTIDIELADGRLIAGTPAGNALAPGNQSYLNDDLIPETIYRRDLELPVTPETYPTTAFLGSEADSIFAQHYSLFRMVEWDTISVRESPASFRATDLNMDGIQELFALYPSGQVRVWRRVIDEQPRFLGMMPRVLEPGLNIIGASIQVSFEQIVYRNLVSDSQPLIIYLPSFIDQANVLINWPDGSVNNFRATVFNGYYTLTKQDQEQ